jgi:hypothetical protein
MTDGGIEKKTDEVTRRSAMTDEIAKTRVHAMITMKLRTVAKAKANIETYAFPKCGPTTPFWTSSILEVARMTIVGT